jgi:hypothetical protein
MSPMPHRQGLISGSLHVIWEAREWGWYGVPP